MVVVSRAKLARFATERLHKDFDQYGLDLSKFLVENISLPPEVEKVLDKRTEMGIVGDLGRFTQYQAATAIEKAASNPSGGGAGDAMTMGMGLAMGQRMAEAMSDAGRKGAGPPPLPA